jgi:glycosyltransferase involved in cell wall biosynthesis
LFGKDLEAHHQLYDGIDVFMYTSQSEGAGLGMLEAASCKIPVITTKVGYALHLKNIKTFDTVDEAVALIEWLDSDPSVISEYTEALANEIKQDWDWKVVADKYWKPVFEKKLGEY